MSKYHLLYTDHPRPDLDIEKEILDRIDCQIIEPEDDSEPSLIASAEGCDIIATCWAKVTDNVIKNASDCKGVIRLGIGLDNIDVKYATDHKIIVTNIPDYCLEEVADHALAFIFGFARNIPFFHLRTKSKEYDLSQGATMHRLDALTIGLIGFGGIGQALFRKAKALGFNVIATSNSMNAQGTGCKMLPLEELLKQSDFVSLHLPLSENSSKFMGEKEFSLMKNNAYLINTSRGGLVDQKALHNAIQNQEIAGAGLDVFDPEPPNLNDPLFCDERVVVTPHAAFVSEESLTELRIRTANQIVDILEGRRPENVINPEALE